MMPVRTCWILHCLYDVVACHSLYSKKGFCVKSYGTGSAVKLPGSSPNQPNIYPFDTTYEQMYQDLYQKDPQLYPMIRIDHQIMFQWVRTEGWVQRIVIVDRRDTIVFIIIYKTVLPKWMSPVLMFQVGTVRTIHWRGRYHCYKSVLPVKVVACFWYCTLKTNNTSGFGGSSRVLAPV